MIGGDEFGDDEIVVAGICGGGLLLGTLFEGHNV